LSEMVSRGSTSFCGWQMRNVRREGAVTFDSRDFTLHNFHVNQGISVPSFKINFTTGHEVHKNIVTCQCTARKQLGKTHCRTSTMISRSNSP
jgi:hypothetical protein